MSNNTAGLTAAAAALASLNPHDRIAEVGVPSRKKGSIGSRGRGKVADVKFPVEPRVIQTIKKPRTIMNHSYRDFSCVPPEAGEETPSQISQMSFPQKVHHILSQPEFERYISWMPHGRAFRINIPKLFEQKVCAQYLGHSRYSSFLRQLSDHSFKHITQGKDRNCYYHEFMLRGMPHLCKYMPKPKDARRLIPDPENEPDFYAISNAFPLPDADKDAVDQPSIAKPTSVASLPAVAGSPRLSSVLNDSARPAKRAKVELAQPMETLQFPAQVPIQASVPLPAPVQTTAPASPQQLSPPAPTSNNDQEGQQLLLRLLVNQALSSASNAPPPVAPPSAPVSPRAPVQVQAQACSSTTPLQQLAALLGGGGNNTQTSAPSLIPPQLNPPAPAPAPVANTSVAALASAIRVAQVQAAQERNEAAIAALRGRLLLGNVQTPSAPNTTNIAAALATALVQQLTQNTGA